jgi:hypothetical protein
MNRLLNNNCTVGIFWVRPIISQSISHRFVIFILVFPGLVVTLANILVLFTIASSRLGITIDRHFVASGWTFRSIVNPAGTNIGEKGRQKDEIVERECLTYSAKI